MANPTSTADPAPVAAVVLGPGGGRRIPGTSVAVKAERRHSGGALTVYEATVAPRHAGPPVHLHRTWDEAFYVLAGAMTFLIDGAEHAAPAGAFVFVPHGVPHAFWNAGAEPARQLTVVTSSGIEDFFEALGALRTGGGALPFEAVTALSERHDTIVLPTDRPPYGPLD